MPPRKISKTTYMLQETAELKNQLIKQQEQFIEDRRKLDQILEGMQSASLPFNNRSPMMHKSNSLSPANFTPMT